MIGVVCAGGHGTRLSPLTNCVSKHLLPVFDKPMIFYPISLCMLAGCSRVVCVINEHDFENYERLFLSLNLRNVSLELVVQESANGILGAIKAATDTIGMEDLMVVLGDNLMYGSSLIENLKGARLKIKNSNNSIIFSIPSSNPQVFGVIEYDGNKNPIDIVEKPQVFISHDVVPGIYFYKSNHLNDIDSIRPSPRNELEVTDFNRLLLRSDRLLVNSLGRGIIWLDCGSFENLIDAGLSISLHQRHSSEKIGDIKEIDSKF